MPPTIDQIEIRHFRLPLDLPFHAVCYPHPQKSFTGRLVCVIAGDYEGVGSDDDMAIFRRRQPGLADAVGYGRALGLKHRHKRR